ncbi:MAG: hypothetical protein R3E56_10815 [Burkholderiaceae bacterium]
MQYIGKYGEYCVLACLLEEDIEAYPAIKTNQTDFDLTAVVPSGKVVRIQVKATELNNQSTNNSIDRVDKSYDFLVVVIVSDEEHKRTARFFIMSKAEAMLAKGTSKRLGTTKQRNRIFHVKDVLLPYEGKWEKIRDA